MSSREQFEAWIAGTTNSDLHRGIMLDRHENGRYRHLATENKWEAWQEATKQSEAKCAALAAENAALNEKMNKLATWPGIEFYSSAWEFNNGDGNAAIEFMCDVQTPATDAFLAEVRAHDLNAFIRHHSAELDAHIKNGGEQFDEKSVRIRDIIVSARLFREQIRKEAAQ
ncbi:hypothetical protein [Enterobacter roggenkampii]|uniref:hypothetical protein n=1 Tax=Enterobacter roggenkampii TaxID=1812935 RepID=UPI002018F511|nr:hypothetical protein [Enterobacter roggenkampii]UQQ51917.1 hypothetical protein MUY33_04490 [Enterobacter roggenkampii]